MEWPTLASLRGVGSGATGGLIKYPAASLMILLDRAVGEGKLTQKEALAVLREQEARDYEEAPVATIAGNVAGSMVPFGLMVKGSAGALKLIGANSALGAASGFSANAENQGTTLEDTALGAGIGGVFGTLGAGISAAARGMATKATEYAIFNKTMSDTAAKAHIRSTLKAGGNKSPKDVDVREFARAQSKELAREMTPRQQAQVIKDPKSSTVQRLSSGVGKAFKGVVPSAVLGGATGFATAPFTGQDPVQNALGYAGAAVLGRKAIAMGNVQTTGKAMGGRTLAKHPGISVSPNVVAPVATTVATPFLTKREPIPSEWTANPRVHSGEVVEDWGDLEQYRVQPEGSPGQGPEASQSPQKVPQTDFGNFEQYRVRTK